MRFEFFVSLAIAATAVTASPVEISPVDDAPISAEFAPLNNAGIPTFEALDGPTRIAVMQYSTDGDNGTLFNSNDVPSGGGTTPTGEAPIPIVYHGGPVMSSINIYLIYYGSWTSSQKATIQAFVNGITTSGWWNIERKYKVGNVRLAGVVNNNYVQGKVAVNVLNIVRYHVSEAKNLPADPNGFYAVLTDVNVTEGQFCSQYCGYHSYGTYNPGNVQLKYAFIGNAATQCPNGCITSLNHVFSPNNDAGVDGLLSIFAHELAEAGSDPLLNAWFDNNGEENGDKCNFNFGSVNRLANGAYFNQHFGGRYWLIQQNWNPQTSLCAQSA